MNFNIDDLELDDIDFGENSQEEFNKINKPIKMQRIPTHCINYRNAVEAVNQTEIKKNTRTFTFLSGNFIFGDYIEALMVENNWIANEMIISTLSLSEDNVYSMLNLLKGGYVKRLHLIVSGFFYSHEKFKIVKVINDILISDKWDFQFTVSEIHTKTIIFDICNLSKKGFIVIRGSANLRSSDSIEQLEVEENEQLYNYVRDFQIKMIDQIRTQKKRVRSNELWNLLNQ